MIYVTFIDTTRNDQDVSRPFYKKEDAQRFVQELVAWNCLNNPIYFDISIKESYSAEEAHECVFENPYTNEQLDQCYYCGYALDLYLNHIYTD